MVGEVPRCLTVKTVVHHDTHLVSNPPSRLEQAASQTHPLDARVPSLRTLDARRRVFHSLSDSFTSVRQCSCTFAAFML